MKDIHEQLAERHAIGLIWNADDVLSIRPDLTHEQAWEVLQRCEHKYDPDGSFWITIEYAAGEMYPEPEDESS